MALLIKLNSQQKTLSQMREFCYSLTIQRDKEYFKQLLKCWSLIIKVQPENIDLRGLVGADKLERFLLLKADPIR